MTPRDIVAAAVILLALGGCTQGADPMNVPTTRPPATPEQDFIAERIVITAETISVIADDGLTLAEFDYFQPASEVVPALDEVFGESIVERRAASGDQTAATTYDWGGMILIDYDSTVVAPYYSDLFLAVSAAEVGGIVIETIDGVRVGDSGPDLETRYPDESHRVTASGEPERIDIMLGFVDHPDEESGEAFGGVAAWVVIAPAEGPVTEIRAPSPLSTEWDWFDDLL